MNTKKKPTLSRIMEISVYVLMALDLVLMILLPWLTDTVTTQRPGKEFYRDYLIILYTSAIIAEFVLWQCRGIMHNVNIGRPFGKDMVRRLRTVGTLCLVLAALYLLFVFVLGFIKFFMALIMVVFAFIGLVLFVFAELFRQAGAYKEENDMTI